MAALTADRITEHKLPGLLPYPVAASTIIYDGSIVGINSAGYAVPAADAAGMKVVGMADKRADNSAGAAGAINVMVKAPLIVVLPAVSITQAMLGTKMYVVDDQTFDDATGTNSIVLGLLVEFLSATKGAVWINPTANLL